MHAILHAEIGDGRTAAIGFHIHIFAEKGVNVLDAFHQRLVVHNLLFALITQTLKQLNWIMTDVMIQFGIEIPEQITSFIVPYPPHVVGNLVQTSQLFGKT